MALTVSLVLEDSIAEGLGIAVGDRLTHINGERVRDFVDFIYFEAMPELDMTIVRPDGEEYQVSIEKDETEPLGIAFEGDGVGKCRACVNKCLFCFVDQLPEGMRKSLYFKDDDWRMSFVMGNYVTLTNVPEQEFERILKRKVSPLYISVHATDDEVRAQMLQQPRGRGILDRLRRLKEAGIYFNCQAVICKGYNDGAVLEKTIADLAPLMPNAMSLALVPVGLTGHREGLCPLDILDPKTASDIIDIAEKWQKKLYAEYGTRFVFCADELYIRAHREFPPTEEYEDFSQLEDGVGMVSLFNQDVRETIGAFGRAPRYREASIVTGVDAAPYIERAARMCEAQYGTHIYVYPVVNEFFGHTVTVTGLLTGGDIARALAGKPLGECLLLSNTMLRDRQDTFLDDMTLQELSGTLGVACRPIDPDGYSFVQAFAKNDNL